MAQQNYAHPEALVSTDWVAEHLNDPAVRIIESNEDVLLYDMGHIVGAVHIDWRADLNDQTIRDYVDTAGFAKLCSRHGITRETTVIFYGDKSNWWACYALWVVADRVVPEHRHCLPRSQPQLPLCLPRKLPMQRQMALFSLSTPIVCLSRQASVRSSMISREQRRKARKHGSIDRCSCPLPS